MKLVTVFFLAIFLVACGGGGGSSTSNGGGTPDPAIPDRVNVLGSWTLEVSPTCTEFLSFGNAGRFRARSDEERVVADFIFLPSQTQRGYLEFQIQSDTGGVNCSGLIDDLTGTILAAYVEFSGNTMEWWDMPSEGNLVLSFDYEDKLFDPIVDPNNTLSLASITPAVAEANVVTQFSVTLDYDVDRDVNIRIGFNMEFRDGYRVLDTVAVSAGAGQVTLLGDGVVPFDWQAENNFSVSAVVSNLGDPQPLSRYQFPIPLTNN